MKHIMLTIFLIIPISAYADWSNTGNPGLSPNLSPNQVQPVQHVVHMNTAPSARVEPQHHVQQARPAQTAQPTRPAQHIAAPAVNRTQEARHDQPARHKQAVKRDAPVTPGYFRRDVDYYAHSRVIYQYSDVDPDPIVIVPNGFETIMVDGQTYYYSEGVFYQKIGDQLVAIQPVFGAVVDSIPQDYQIVMADGTHYLFTKGVFYQRVDQGFEVVAPPGSDQE